MSETFTDDAGTRHDAAGPDARILSLVPSLTELVFDLGLAGRTVGRTAFCVHPAPEVRAVPSVGGTKRVNMEKVLATGATHALVNVDETPKQVADALAEAGLEVIVTHPIEAADNLKLFRLIGGLFGRADAAEALSREFTQALDALAAAVAGRPQARVLYLIWQDPWMTVSADTYISKFLALAGWRTAAHDAAARYPEIELTGELLGGVDHVLFSTEPFSFTDAHLAAFAAAHPGHAAKARLIDAEMVSWYGSRAIRGLAYLRDFTERSAP